MGTSYRVRIGIREIQAMEPNTILWDLEVKGFVARRQFSDIVTFSVVYRTRDNVQRWQKLARFPILTPHLARQEAINPSGKGAGDKTQLAKSWLSEAVLPSRNYATNINSAITARSLERSAAMPHASKVKLSRSWGSYVLPP